MKGHIQASHFAYVIYYVCVCSGHECWSTECCHL